MSFMIEEFKKTFQENHQPLFKNIKKQIRNSSRDSSNENKQNLHNDNTPTLNTNLLNKNIASKQNQQKFFVYVNSPNSPNSCPLKEESQQCQKENNLKQSQRFQQRGFQKQSNTLYTDENTQQSQLEETLSLSMSDLNTIQPNNITLNSFRNSINSQIQFQILQKNLPQKKVISQHSQNVMPLQNNQLYLNQQEHQDQDKKRTNSYLNTYNIKKSQNNNTQMNKQSSKNQNNTSDVQNYDDKITQKQMIQKKYLINYDTEESLDLRNTQKSIQNGNNKNFNCQQTDYQERVSSNSSVNNLDKIKGLQTNNKGYSLALNSVQSMLQSNQHYSTQSIADGNFSLASYGLNQYYLLNMHHIVRIQRFFKNKCIQIQQRLNQAQNYQRQIRVEHNLQQGKVHQNNLKQQSQICERRNSVQNNNGSTFINSYQQQQDNMSNMNNVSNSFNFEVVSFGQKDNLYQPSDKNSSQQIDLGYQRQSYQNQTFEEVEEVEEEVDEVGDDDDNIQTPFHHYPGITYIQSSGGFEQQINSLQRLQSVDIDNIQGRFDQEEDVNQQCTNQQYNSSEMQKQNNQNNQQTKLKKQESFSNYQNQKITQNSPKFPVNVDNQFLNSISQQQNENQFKTKLDINDKENLLQIQCQQSYKPESQQSTTSASSSHHHSIETLKQENTKLKKMMYQMKLDMKSQLEEGLVQQKNQMKTINDEYLQFIEKIMTDKKELTKKCDNLLQENQQLLQQIEKKEHNQSEKKVVQNVNEQFLTAELDSKQDESNYNDQLLEKLKNTQIENEKIYDSFVKQQEFILKLQKENEELVQKLQKINVSQNNQQKSNNDDDQCKDDLIEYLQNQIEQLNSQLQEERQQNEELQSQINQSNTKTNHELNKQFLPKDYDQEFENFKQQFVSEISEKVEELQNQLEQERENVNKLLHSSKFDGNEIVNQLRTENKMLKQQLIDNQSKSCQKEGSRNQNEFDSVKINELETLISQMEEERKQACEMVKLMKEAHDKLKSKYEDEIKQLKEKHQLEFCKYEENIRYTIEKKVKNEQIFKFNLKFFQKQGLKHIKTLLGD
ncbi:hypothetical protein TTHERM_00703860 (macronuclear) [Tetrahymena thermophila SB210]|uniref:Uncharacterized protein n=1 Tax=Tetrahymena thermophila (strain SB210) TaxID=312017 RepID=Q22GD7_TETTS|nr:hypothetical protein TTHERM_00703860 [Tetrahymena thermophila SB210]EAR84394.2 hypothetical protein TTHERM_00703860 [Tetrahymena thermophila SB210]|eukprot:XP_001032057.2 hypothetical protein TTHERM_00703860 [Tetrahymena thermophila SB210]